MIKLWMAAVLGVAGLLPSAAFVSDVPKHDRHYYETRGEVIWEVPTDNKIIAFTFDDGPNAATTPLILDLLRQYDAKATFFVVGNRIDGHLDIIKRQVSEGHEVANHTYNHVLFNSRHSMNLIHREIESTQKKLYEATGTLNPWFRPPGGNYSDRVVEAAKTYGYTVALWSWHQDTKDWQLPGVDKIVAKVLKNARNGDIVLMHDNVKGPEQTYLALQKILPELQARGFKFVTLSELVKYKRSDEVHRQH